MKSLLSLHSRTLAASLALLLTTACASPGEAPSALKVERVHRAGHGSVNSFLLVGRDSVAIIDAQRAIAEAREVVAAARAVGKPVEAIVLTHEHPDHIGGLAVLTEAFPQAAIHASAPTTRFIREQGTGLVKAMRETFGFGDAFPAYIPVPGQLLVDGQRLTLAGVTWTVQQLGAGEAESMTLLSSAEQRVVFVADLAGNAMTPWLVDGHVLRWMAQLDDAVKRYAGYTLYPGHGAPAPADLVLGEQRRYLAEFVEDVRREMTPGSAQLGDVALARIRARVDARYPGFPRVAPPPMLIEINAQAVAKALTESPQQ